MSLSENLETAKLDEARSALLSRGQKISSLLASLVDSSKEAASFKEQREKLAGIFETEEAFSPTGRSDAKNQLKQELFDLDLKFSGGKKGSKSNQELALEKIVGYLESLMVQIEDLEKDQQERYLKTPEGQAQSERERENKERCRQEILPDLFHLDDMENIAQLGVSPKHLELAGIYGVELTQEMILAEWKKMVSELLLRDNFIESKEVIRNFQKYKPLDEAHNRKVDRAQGSAAKLKTLEDQTVLSLADIIAHDPEVRQKFYRYGITGSSLAPNMRKVLADYDDLPEGQISDSPAALAYEYIHHLLHIISGSDYSHQNHLNHFVNFFHFRNLKGGQPARADVFGQKYSAKHFYLSGQQNQDIDFLLDLGGKLENLILVLQQEIKAEGNKIDPKSFIARFGQENYGLAKDLPKLSDLETKIVDFPKKYEEPDGRLTKSYYQDEAIFNQFDAQVKRLEEKLSLILAIRWLEEELKQKRQKNPELWEALDDKIRLVDYLKFLGHNQEYHVKQLIEVSTNERGELELLDIANRRLEEERKKEYQKLEEDYKKYLKAETALIVSEINRNSRRIFNQKDSLADLDKRLGTCQILSSYSLSDRIYGRISSFDLENFQEASLTPVEWECLQRFWNEGYDNLKEQESIRERYRASEKDLNRYQNKLDVRFLSDCPDLIDSVSTYEQLIANLKLINITLSSLLREKYSGLIKDFSAKSQEYQRLVGDYNRKYHHDEYHQLIPTLDFRGDLVNYL